MLVNPGKIYKVIYLVEHMLEVTKEQTYSHQNLTKEVGPQTLLHLQTQGIWCLFYPEDCIHPFRQERSAKHLSLTKSTFQIVTGLTF